LNLRRSNRHEQEIPIGVNAGLRHGIRAGDWQFRIFDNSGSTAAFSAAAELSIVNRPAAAFNPTNDSIDNRSAATAGYSAHHRSEQPKHNQHDFLNNLKQLELYEGLPEAVGWELGPERR
jgi:hypothetical protein